MKVSRLRTRLFTRSWAAHCTGLVNSCQPALLCKFSCRLAQFVFGTCAAGAVVLTVNVVLLGGNIGFFQSMCLLGYCLFPMDVAAIVTACTTNMIARWIVVLVRPLLLSDNLHVLSVPPLRQHGKAQLELTGGEAES